jgi:hypothetical protein
VHFDVVPVRCIALLRARVLGDVTMMNQTSGTSTVLRYTFNGTECEVARFAQA